MPELTVSIMYEENIESHVAINTPFGQTDRFSPMNKEMQGSVHGPIKCSNQVDTHGKQCTENNENLYNYKGTKLPPLSSIDDLATFSECGQPSLKMNTFINAKIELKKLEFNDTKCKTIHVGNENEFCPDLQVHGLKIGKSEEEKYLSDIITCNNSIKTNIESRFSKGIGLIAQIMSLLDEVTFGERYFEVAVLLRQSIFI